MSSSQTEKIGRTVEEVIVENGGKLGEPLSELAEEIFAKVVESRRVQDNLEAESLAEKLQALRKI